MELLRETKFCSGIENYSRHISGRAPGSAPYTLMDYFPKDFLMFIDESHATIPQVRAMYNLSLIHIFFCTYPDAAKLLKGLHVMNGYFGEAPLPEPYYNWNSWADPLASQIVFSSQAAVHRAIPLEVTDKLTIEAKQAALLFDSGTDLMLSLIHIFGQRGGKQS